MSLDLAKAATYWPWDNPIRGRHTNQARRSLSITSLLIKQKNTDVLNRLELALSKYAPKYDSSCIHL